MFSLMRLFEKKDVYSPKLVEGPEFEGLFHPCVIATKKGDLDLPAFLKKRLFKHIFDCFNLQFLLR